MKIRQAFVANSSSSSFLIVGNKIDYETLKSQTDVSEFIEEYGEDDLCYEITELHRKQTGLYCTATDEDYDRFYVGAKIFDDYDGSMSIEDLESKIISAKKLLADKGISDYKVYFGEKQS